jgi:predicted esterase
MSSESHHFEVTKTARYFTLGPALNDQSQVLIALHGYGQLPEFFLRRFQPLVDLGWTIVAPEGFHRFYTEGTSGRVGASWMTKEDRHTDMVDYVRYLDALAAHLALTDRRPALLGFSQGVATAARWASLGNVAFSRLIFWAGVFPPDLDWTHEIQPLISTPIDVAVGDSDPYFNVQLLHDTASLLEKHGIPHASHTFEGGHAVDSTLLAQLLSKGA